MRAPVRLTPMQGSCRTEMRRMRGQGRHEGWMARHEVGGSAFACVVPSRFPNPADEGDRARPDKVLPAASAPRTS